MPSPVRGTWLSVQEPLLTREELQFMGLHTEEGPASRRPCLAGVARERACTPTELLTCLEALSAWQFDLCCD